MARKALEIGVAFKRDDVAKYIAQTWFNYNSQRTSMIERWKEIRNYVFATDTSTTSNKSLPWKNSTTLPKLCQIRDNLHSNYQSALFPNDDWLKWEPYSRQDATKEKTAAIEAYMANKTRQSHFRTETSKSLLDYIDYGNVFGTVEFEQSFITNAKGERIPNYIGPRHKRISPYDIVFNPLASSFQDSWKIIRELKDESTIRIMAEEEPENMQLANAILNRKNLKNHAAAYGIENTDKADGFLVDGFGNYYDYLQSGYVEFLTFYGDIMDSEGVLRKGQKIVVIDRMWVISFAPYVSWLGHAPIYHVGWRIRPDNLWSMGPLENLVGMQYRIDHLENLKADAMDLAVLPPLVIKGEVEEFKYAPNAEIHIDENGEVTELARNVQWVIASDNSIQLLEQRMEQYAGAPREAMGIRTPGEKTMYEVQRLENAAGRIFQEKITTFEVEYLEPILNAMLETARRNLDRTDVLRVMDNDVGASTFMTITKDDIIASGNIRPIGARHFAAQAQLVQNLTGLANTPVWNQIAPHMSSVNLAKLVEEVMGLRKYTVFKPNIAVVEQQETARLANQAGEQLQIEQATPPIE